MPKATRRYTYPYQLSPNFVQGKYYYENFKGGQTGISWVEGATNSHPVMPLATGGASDGELDAAVVMNTLTPGGMFWQTYCNTAQTKNPWIGVAGSGINISGDAVDNETLEFVPGGNSAYSRLAFTVGTDNDFFFRAKFKFTDASGSDQFGIGFRKQEAFTAATSFLTGADALYTDFALFGFAATKANPNPLNVSTDLNNSGVNVVTPVNFTVADGLVHKLEVRVIGAKIQLFINGIRVGNPVAKDGDGAAITSQSTTSAPSFTFDTGDTLIPFIFLRHDTDVLESQFLQEVEIGQLVDVGLDPNNETVAQV
jgi:hypothetical protein